jgi:hypothetical protein
MCTECVLSNILKLELTMDSGDDKTQRRRREDLEDYLCNSGGCVFIVQLFYDYARIKNKGRKLRNKLWLPHFLLIRL